MKRLYRIKHKGKIGGVCAGLGEYLEVDPTIIRLIMLLLLFTGPGLIIYLIMLIALPAKDETSALDISETPSEELAEENPNDSPAPNLPAPTSATDLGLWTGFALIIIGGLILLRNFGINWFYWVHFRTLWPFILIIAGLYILLRNDGRKKD